MQKIFRRVLTIYIALYFISAVCPVFADVQMPKIFSSKMVLQRGMKVPVWGLAEKGEKITVALGGQKAETEAGQDGKWMVRLNEFQAGGPYTMIVSGKNRLVFDDVLFGDVWLCSGQSNMGFRLKSAENAETEIPQANFPKIRLATVPCTSKADPQDDVNMSPWTECTPESAANFTAVGYFFGKKIYQELNIPIGLINNSWGGATCEAYVNPKLLTENPDFAPMLDPDRIAKQKAQYRAGYLYNGMLLPIIPYGIKGVIWYQGCSNQGRAVQYRTLFKAMIKNWRDEWGQGDFPFYYVQLANFLKVQPNPSNSTWAELREAQTMALDLPKTGQAVIIDIGEAGDIHPKNKLDVGLRLAAIALHNDYGRDIVWASPMYQSMQINDNKIIVTFKEIGGGLAARGNDGVVKGFALAGADKIFYWADAKIDGNKVIVSCDKVAAPVAVRYAWSDNPVCNLYNKEGFPVCPFRSDNWKELSFGKK